MHTWKEAVAICASAIDTGYISTRVHKSPAGNEQQFLAHTPSPFPKYFDFKNTATFWSLHPAGYHSCFCVPSWLTNPVRTIRHFRKKDERERKDSHQNRTYCVFPTLLVNSLLTLNQEDSTTHFPDSVYRQRTPLVVSEVTSHRRSPQNKAWSPLQRQLCNKSFIIRLTYKHNICSLYSRTRKSPPVTSKKSHLNRPQSYRH